MFKSALLMLLCLSVIVSAGMGAYPMDIATLWSALWTDNDPTARAVLLHIRLPRILLALLVGASLAAAGTALQAIFRNPLADPGLIGVSSGAALGAAVAIVMVPWLGWSMVMLPVAAFVGALGVVMVVYRLAAHQGQLVLSWLLLAGIAINALAGALIGLLTYFADDAQLRSLTFWSLGSLGGAAWSSLMIVAPIVFLGLGVLLNSARSLTVLQLGEAEASHLGVPVHQLKRRVLTATALSVGALVSMTGIIGFIGLVAPHCVRLITGPDQRCVLPAAMMFGALLSVLADLAARTLAMPADIPLGILTGLMGAPFFLVLLMRSKAVSV